MAPNAQIDQVGREAFTAEDPRARIDAAGREAWLSFQPKAQLVMVGRETWVPVATGSKMYTQVFVVS